MECGRRVALMLHAKGRGENKVCRDGQKRDGGGHDREGVAQLLAPLLQRHRGCILGRTGFGDAAGVGVMHAARTRSGRRTGHPRGTHGEGQTQKNCEHRPKDCGASQVHASRKAPDPAVFNLRLTQSSRGFSKAAIASITVALRRR